MYLCFIYIYISYEEYMYYDASQIILYFLKGTVNTKIEMIISWDSSLMSNLV